MTLEDLTEDEIINYGEMSGIRLYPISIFYSGKNKRKSTVLLGFASLTVDEIKKGILSFSNKLK